MDGIVVSIYIILKFLLTTLSVLIRGSFRNPRVKSNCTFSLLDWFFSINKKIAKQIPHTFCDGAGKWWQKEEKSRLKIYVFFRFFLVTNDQLKKQNQRKKCLTFPLCMPLKTLHLEVVHLKLDTEECSVAKRRIF